MPPMTASPFSSAAKYSMDNGAAFAEDPGQRTIMVIDDSLAVRRIIEASFSRIGLATATFPDGISAIQALAKRRSRCS